MIHSTNTFSPIMNAGIGDPVQSVVRGLPPPYGSDLDFRDRVEELLREHVCPYLDGEYTTLPCNMNTGSILSLMWHQECRVGCPGVTSLTLNRHLLEGAYDPLSILVRGRQQLQRMYLQHLQDQHSHMDVVARTQEIDGWRNRKNQSWRGDMEVDVGAGIKMARRGEQPEMVCDVCGEIGVHIECITAAAIDKVRKRRD